MQQHRIEEFEDGGVGADAQCQGGDDDERKARTLDEDAQRAAQIVPEALETEGSIFCRDALAHDGGIAEAPARLALRRLAAHALGHVVVDAHGHVFAQFRVDLTLQARAFS